MLSRDNSTLISKNWENKSMNSQQSITEAFNTYFLSVADNIINNKNQDYSLDEDNNISKDISVHFLSQTLHVLYP
jgi:hypothetical protein